MEHNILNNFSLLSFSSANSINEQFDLFYNILVNKWKITELALFMLDENNNMFKLNNISASVTLKNIYNELEERGLLDFAANTNTIKIIPNIDETIEQINSIIIIPVFMFNKIAAYFIANTTLNQNNINTNDPDINIIHFIAEHFFALININEISINKNIENQKYNLLKQQLTFASNQIAKSEILSTLNDGFDTHYKIIKTNLELIQKNIGNQQRRIEIINEQFNHITEKQNIIQKLSNEIENIPTKNNIYDIIEQVINISNPILNKHGITLTTDIKDSNIFINCFRTQTIFAIYTFIAKSIAFMMDGGKINIGMFENTNNTISIIISNNLNEIDSNEIEGNIVSLLNLSPQKMKLHFLYTLAEHIITSHKGKVSLYKGNTYKIILPIYNHP